MTRDLAIEKIIKLVRSKFGKIKSIRTIYLHGSILTERFSDTSDVDLLFIVDDVTNRNNFLEKIKSIRSTIKEFNLDIGIVFYSEFIHLWHIFRTPTYFIWIKKNNILIQGEDLLNSIRENTITVNSIYKRAVDLAQGCRSVYINDKNVSFWEKKYIKWLHELEYGILFLCGEIEPDHEICEDKLCSTFPELKKIKLLRRKRLPIKLLSEISELLVNFIKYNFIK